MHCLSTYGSSKQPVMESAIVRHHDTDGGTALTLALILKPLHFSSHWVGACRGSGRTWRWAPRHCPLGVGLECTQLPLAVIYCTNTRRDTDIITTLTLAVILKAFPHRLDALSALGRVSRDPWESHTPHASRMPDARSTPRALEASFDFMWH